MTRLVPLERGKKFAYTIHTLGAGETFFTKEIPGHIPRETVEITRKKFGNPKGPASFKVRALVELLIMVEDMCENNRSSKKILFFRTARLDKNRDNHSEDEIGLMLPIEPTDKISKKLRKLHLLSFPCQSNLVPVYNDEVAVRFNQDKRVYILLAKDYDSICSVPSL